MTALSGQGSTFDVLTYHYEPKLQGDVKVPSGFAADFIFISAELLQWAHCNERHFGTFAVARIVTQLEDSDLLH